MTTVVINATSNAIELIAAPPSPTLEFFGEGPQGVIGPQGEKGINLDETAKIDGSVVYYDAASSKFKEDATVTRNDFVSLSGNQTITGNKTFSGTIVLPTLASLSTSGNVVVGGDLTVGTIGSGTWQANSIAISYGGTGAVTASGARTNLELGTMAVQNANNVNITGGNISGVTMSGVTMEDMVMDGGSY